MTFSLKIFGLGKVVVNLGKQSKQYRSALAAALLSEANATMRLSQENAPEVSGRLKRSAFVIPPKLGGMEVLLGYAAPYATKVHERNVTGEKRFLLRARNARAKGLATRLAAATKANKAAKIGIRRITREFNTRPRDAG